jgi:hypothetical protein
MKSGRRQFRALVRLFAYRFFDTDILSVQGDVSQLLAQFAALLAALSLVLVIMTGPKYASLYQHLNPHQLRMAAWGDQQFLISTSMAIVGILTLFLWDALFPDRRDCMILGVMPLGTRQVFAAKATALAAALGIAILAVNCFTGLVCPFLIVRDAPGPLAAARNFAAYWLVIVLASVFVFLLLLAVQGAALHLLSHARFMRWSSTIQMAAFFATLALYFLSPPVSSSQTFGPRSGLWLALVPSYWFFGLFRVMTGSADALAGALARRALWGVASVTLAAALFYALAYARQMRRTIEQSGIVPASRGINHFSPAHSILSRHAPERAILSFIRHTLARSRQHRLMLSIYTGMGLAYVFSQMAYVLYHFRADAFGAIEGREQTALGIPLILLFFLVIGLRVSFSIPVELRANWLFRLTDPFAHGAYLRAARKTLLTFALLPVVTLSACIYPAAWPWPKAAEHVVFLTVFGLLIIELALTGFAKVPFTCSYLPGRANLKIMFGVYWGLLIIVSDVVTQIESQALHQGYAKLISVILIAWLLAAFRTRGAQSRIPSLSFEEQPEPVVVGLGLRS